MMTNARDRFVIFTRITYPNRMNYQNANRFLHAFSVIGSEALNENLESLKAKGIEIESVVNGCGEKIDF